MIKRLWSRIFHRQEPTFYQKLLAVHMANATAKARGAKIG